MARTIRPLRMTANDGTQYMLEFDRYTIKRAESAGFDISAGGKSPVSYIEDLFFYSFMKNHARDVSRSESKTLWGEIPSAQRALVIERLVELYTLPINALFDADNDEGKNRNAALEF